MKNEENDRTRRPSACLHATPPAPTSKRTAAQLPHVDCGVVIVTYNSENHILECINSLPRALGGLSHRTVVVDNGSTDETCARLSEEENITLLKSDNRGYAAAINLGREALGSVGSVLILNPDVRLQAHSVERLTVALSQDGVGVTVPRIVDGGGMTYPSLRREPALGRALVDAIFGGRWVRRPGWAGEIVQDKFRYEIAHPVEWATGAAWLVSSSCWQDVGPWDEDFFLYSEEVDYARRCRRQGYVVWYEPAAIVKHFGGGSSTSPLLTALMAVNRVRYYEKHHKPSSARLMRAIVAMHEVARGFRPDHRKGALVVMRKRSWPALTETLRSSAS